MQILTYFDWGREEAVCFAFDYLLFCGFLAEEFLIPLDPWDRLRHFIIMLTHPTSMLFRQLGLLLKSTIWINGGKHYFLSYFYVKIYIVAVLTSTHNLGIWKQNKKNITIYHLKVFIFCSCSNCSILNRTKRW